ncbi:MAG: Crp/Fnr family transcriptional regulator [Candidatus Angelobacter sp.]
MSVIENSTLFQGFSKEALAQVQEAIERKSYSPGALIFQGGEPANYLYVLEEGRVRLRFGQTGQVAYALNEPGDVFGWSSLVNQKEYTLSAQSVSAVSVARFEKDQLLRILENDAPSGMAFFRHLGELIGQRLFNSYKATVSVHGERSSLSYG